MSLEAAYELIEPWTAEERQRLRDEVPRLGLHTPHDRSTLFDVAAQAVGIAEAGLVRRNRLNGKGEDETIYLSPLEETIHLAKSPAERWLDRYRGEWNGDLSPIFREAEI